MKRLVTLKFKQEKTLKTSSENSISKVYTTIKVYASKHSNFSFKVNDSINYLGQTQTTFCFKMSTLF